MRVGLVSNACPSFFGTEDEGLEHTYNDYGFCYFCGGRE